MWPRQALTHNSPPALASQVLEFTDTDHHFWLKLGFKSKYSGCRAYMPNYALCHSCGQMAGRRVQMSARCLPMAVEAMLE